MRYLLHLCFRLIKSSAAVSYQLNRFDVLCVQRCSSVYPCCNVCLFALLSLSCQPFSSDLSLNKAFLPLELLLTGCFLFFSPFSANSRDCCVWKSQEIRSFWNIQTALSDTDNHSTVKVTEITFLPHSDIWSEKTAETLDHICMLLWIYYLLSHNWQLKYFH